MLSKDLGNRQNDNFLTLVGAISSNGLILLSILPKGMSVQIGCSFVNFYSHEQKLIKIRNKLLIFFIFSAENIDLRISEFKNYVCIIYLNIFSIKDGSIWPFHGTDLVILMALRCWSEWTILQSSKPRMKKLMNNSTEITDRKRQDSNNNFLFLYNKHFLLPDFVNFKIIAVGSQAGPHSPMQFFNANRVEDFQLHDRCRKS